MSIANLDFQPILHQHITQLMPLWQQGGFSEDEVQETASQFFQMGLIAGQQLQQEGSVPVQGTDKSMPYTEPLATKIVVLFLDGLHPAILKAHEYHLPSQEKWQLMQNVAYHVFEQAKQIGLVTMGQENTPGSEIDPNQIRQWQIQTSTEALLYYIMEYEKQHGPINKTDAIPNMPDLLNAPEYEAPEEQHTEPVSPPPAETQEEVPQPVAQVEAPQTPPPAKAPAPVASTETPDIHHQYAAIGLLLSGLSTGKQKSILSAFTPEEQQWIQVYRDPDKVANTLNLGKVAEQLRRFKDKLGKSNIKPDSQYMTRLSSLLFTLPQDRLVKLLQPERPFVRGYINQLAASRGQNVYPYVLPDGVEESLLLYMQRNFPQESQAQKVGSR